MLATTVIDINGVAALFVPLDIVSVTRISIHPVFELTRRSIRASNGKRIKYSSVVLAMSSPFFIFWLSGRAMNYIEALIF